MVRLPLAPADLRPAPEPARAAPAFGARVLVAEDNAVNQRLIAKLLERLGCFPTMAGDGREALDLLAKEEFDLVLMDCQMPTLDGFEAARAIRLSEAATSAARMPIVALTANAMRGDRERCLEAGMDDYLTKPLKRADLERTLARWLDA